MEFDVFLSHQGMDKEKVIQLANYLEPELACWFAPRNIPSGKENYGPVILDAVEQCNVFLVFLTENFERDPENHVINEVYHARKHRKKIIPLLIGRNEYPREIELHLNSHQWMYFETFDDRLFLEVAHAIRALLHDEDAEINEHDFFTQTKSQGVSAPHGFNPISAQVVDKHRHAYIPTVDFATFNPAEPIKLFFGDHAQEKTTQAINYLQQLEKEKLYEGLSLEALESLQKEEIRENAGYIVHIDATELGRTFTDNVFDYLATQLKEKDAILILCTDKRVQIVPETYEILLPEDKEMYLMKKITWELTDDKEQERATTLLNHVAERVNVSEIDCEDALNELADEIIASLHDPEKEAQLIQTATFIHSNTFPLPFDLEKGDNLNDILYNLSISLRHGSSYDVIAATYNRLLAMFQQFFPERQINYHQRALSSLVRDYQLQLKRVESHTMLGTYDDTAVFYTYDVVQKRVWSTVWREYPYQPFLAHVLITFMNDKDERVREETEKIAQTIFNEHFEQAVEYIVFPLAKSKQLGDKLLVKRLIVHLYDDQRFKIKIIRLLKNWLHVPNKELEQTALIVLQSKIGIENYRDTFAWMLTILAKNKYVSNTLYITYSYVNKYVYVQPNLEKQYYDMLREKLVAWRDEEVFEPFIQLLLRFMRNNSAMYFQSTSPFVRSFFVYLLSFFVIKNRLQISANALRQYLFDLNEYETGKEQYQAILQDLKDKLSPDQFNALIETIKKGDA